MNVLVARWSSTYELDEKVTSPAPEFTVRPPSPSWRVLVVVPVFSCREIETGAVELKVMDLTALLMLFKCRFWFVLTVVILNTTSSDAPGKAAGLGVVAPESVDQLAVRPQLPAGSTPFQ
jgi:hypothetical protein